MEDRLYPGPPRAILHSALQKNIYFFRADADSASAILHPLVVVNVSDN